MTCRFRGNGRKLNLGLCATHLLIIAVILAATPAFGQWTLDCTSAAYPSSAMFGTLQMRASGSDSNAFYVLDSLRLQITHTPCSPNPTYQYTFTSSERTALYRYAYSAGRDLTGDGLHEIILLIIHSTPSVRYVTRIIDIAGGTTVFLRDQNNLSYTIYPWQIDDFDGDGTLECIVTLQNLSTNARSYEVYDTGISTAAGGGAGIGGTFALEQNYPNPFNPETRISYSLSRAGHVAVSVYNTTGQRVATLVDEAQAAGEHTASWSAGGTASGVYFYEIRIDGAAYGARRMVLIR